MEQKECMGHFTYINRFQQLMLERKSAPTPSFTLIAGELLNPGIFTSPTEQLQKLVTIQYPSKKAI